LILLVLICASVRADLPIHCLKEDIIGDWTFELTSIEEKTSLLLNACGHDFPDNPLTSYKAMKDLFVTDQTVSISLLQNNSVTYDTQDRLFRSSNDSSALGSWTMVYNEGFELRVSEHRFFSFSHY